MEELNGVKPMRLATKKMSSFVKKGGSDEQQSGAFLSFSVVEEFLLLRIMQNDASNMKEKGVGGENRFDNQRNIPRNPLTDVRSPCPNAALCSDLLNN